VRAIQRMQFRAKNVKNDLNPIDLVKRNFCFEMEGVYFSALLSITYSIKLHHKLVDCFYPMIKEIFGHNRLRS
jgi:hypothetical protein